MDIYVSGIDKGSGKTIVAAGIAGVMQSLDYNTAVYKPIEMSAVNKGSYMISPDLSFVKMFDPYITTHSTYMLNSDMEPAIASELDNIDFNIDDIKRDYKLIKKKSDAVIVEAIGGLMTPLKDNLFSAHIPLNLKLSVVFVINPVHNAISHYINELNTAKTAGLNISGVIINKYPLKSDSEEVKYFPSLLEKYTDVKLLGVIKNFKGKAVKSNVLFNEILNGIDIQEVFKLKIPKLNIEK